MHHWQFPGFHAIRRPILVFKSAWSGSVSIWQLYCDIHYSVGVRRMSWTVGGRSLIGVYSTLHHLTQAIDSRILYNPGREH